MEILSIGWCEMKVKKWKLIIIVLFVIAIIVALVKRQEYTNILLDENNLKQFFVAPLPNEILPDSMEVYKEQLLQSPIVLRVKAVGTREYSAKTIKQQAEVLEVYKGSGINVQEEIDILTTRNSFDFEDMTFNLGFTNLMQKDNEYLVFFDEKINSPYKGDNIYRISDLIINPIFNYNDVENIITPDEEYIPYSLVLNNEFIVGDSIALERILAFKHELLEMYPR